MRGPGSILTGVTFCHWIFWFSRSKGSDANIGIIANDVCLFSPVSLVLLVDAWAECLFLSLIAFLALWTYFIFSLFPSCPQADLIKLSRASPLADECVSWKCRRFSLYNKPKGKIKWIKPKRWFFKFAPKTPFDVMNSKTLCVQTPMRISIRKQPPAGCTKAWCLKHHPGCRGGKYSGPTNGKMGVTCSHSTP